MWLFHSVRDVATAIFAFLAVAVATGFISSNIRHFASKRGFDTFLDRLAEHRLIRAWAERFGGWENLRKQWLLWLAIGLSGGLAVTLWVQAAINAQLTTRLNEPLTIVQGKTFMNQRVQLDGFRYVQCTFSAVTFVYNGGRAELINNSIGTFGIASDIPEIGNAIKALHDFGFLKIPLVTDYGPLRPSNPVPTPSR